MFRLVGLIAQRLRQPWIMAPVLAAFVLTVGVGATLVAAHAGHPDKKVFTRVWNYQPVGDNYDEWMTLSLSDIVVDCDGDETACLDKWVDPFDNAVADWNSQPTTVRLQYDEGVTEGEFDIVVRIFDTIPDMEPDILGIAKFYDINGDECGQVCNIYHGEVLIADDTHVDDYGTLEDRQATLAHEIGHLLGLAHESIDLPCGIDDLGEVPHTIMAYDCSDPPPGLHDIAVQPWDACGVNHLYFDPTIGYAGCGTDYAWGDSDCNGQLTTRDLQALLRSVLAQNPLSQTQPCNAVGLNIFEQTTGNTPWGDFDCSGSITARDSQALLRFILGQAPLSQTELCLDVGAEGPVI